MWLVIGCQDALGIVLEVEFAALGAEVVGGALVLNHVLSVCDDDLHTADGVDGDTGGRGDLVHGCSLRPTRPSVLARILHTVSDRPKPPRPFRTPDDRKLLMQQPVADTSFLESDAWRALRIMGEFIDGFDALARLGPAVSIFGSARTSPDDPVYQQARELAAKLSDQGFTIITGGGPGIMEAANRGAKEADGVSVGLAIELPHEHGPNPYVDLSQYFRYFFVRKTMFVKYAQAFVIFPGGFGTFDELFESLTLVQTDKIDHFPIILFGSDYWSGLLDWIGSEVVQRGNVSARDLDLLEVCDDIDQVVDIISESYRTRDDDSTQEGI